MILLITNPTHAQPQLGSVYLADYTWSEVRDRLRAGTTTIIIPAGGTEQNGPHMALGKHNAIVYYTAGEIARNLGNALVAPVIDYVPVGRIQPPEGHMRFHGSISVREHIFAGLLEDAARSFKQHGFINIILLGDHGGSQPIMQEVADKLSLEWITLPTQVIHANDYFDNHARRAWATKTTIKSGAMFGHAGFAETSELLATDRRLVREKMIKDYRSINAQGYGVIGNPEGANPQHGAQLLQLKIQAAVQQIRGAAR